MLDKHGLGGLSDLRIEKLHDLLWIELGVQTV